MSLFLSIKNILSKNKLVLLLILIGIFLRLYKLADFATFLGDQGRDAIIIKRIITFEHFPAIGPTSSVGQVFLGPFFYYLMTPFLFLFNFDPVGLAFGSAFFSIVGFIVIYLLIRKEINQKAALIFLIFIVFSSTQIDFSRFSWNPNLLPIFSFLTIYFFYKFIATKKYFFALMFGAFLSFSIQLHYLSMFLFVLISAFYLLYLLRGNEFSKTLYGIFLAILSFLLFSSPLIIFDLKHNFLNSRNFIKIFTDQKVISSSSLLNRILTTINSFFVPILKTNLNIYLTLFLFLAFIYYFFKKKSFNKNLFLQINFLNFFFYIFSFSLLDSFRFPHYYGQIYLSFFLVLAYLLAEWGKNKLLRSFTLGILIIYIILNAKNYIFLYQEGSKPIWRAKIVAQSIIERNPRLPFQVVPIPFTEMDGHIRYFLELLGKRPLSEDSNKQPQELYALCYENGCEILNNPQWQIAAFKNKKVDSIWNIDRVKIYKVVHQTI